MLLPSTFFFYFFTKSNPFKHVYNISVRIKEVYKHAYRK
nr:MAG TPA: hypothetical protein [Caudoviricetes sp.]